MNCENCKNYVAKKPTKPKLPHNAEQWKAGDYAWWDGTVPEDDTRVDIPQIVCVSKFKDNDNTINQLYAEINRGEMAQCACDYISFRDMILRVETLSEDDWYVMPGSLRPLTDEDWTGEIGGARVRAYEFGDGTVLLIFADNSVINTCASDYEINKFCRTVCREHNIPIMPRSLHKGNCKRPEDG
ncbi:MAG: hypothetical protein M0P69_20580 [Bacteroidales bacterium]|nr:hypothetical protein [Bacteroidales bacterium]